MVAPRRRWRSRASGTSVSASITVKAGSKQTLAYVQAQDADGNWGPAHGGLDPEGLTKRHWVPAFE